MSMDNNYYIIDEKDIIIEVNSSVWDSFIHENNGDEKIFSSMVINTSIYDHVKGEPTKMYLDTLLGYVRTHKKSIQREYRCDSPDLARYMKMVMLPLEEGGVKVTHVLLKTVEKNKVDFKYQSGSLTLRCSMCGKIRNEGQWTEVESEKIIPVAYTICSSCSGK